MMARYQRPWRAAIWLAMVFVSSHWAAQQVLAVETENKLAPEKSAATQALFQAFAQKLSGAEFVGHFSISGKEAKFEEERYTIASVAKLPDGDFWLFNARIRYGGKDLTVPIPLEVKWAGATPIITLEAVTIPGLGTFDARVLIDGDKYAGTWRHDKIGGHLFGHIERPAAEPPRK